MITRMSLKFIAILLVIIFMLLIVGIFLISRSTNSEDSFDSDKNASSEEIYSSPLDQAMAERIESSFKEMDCPEPKRHDPTYYSGQIIDAHFHISVMPDADPGEPLGDPSERVPYMGVDITIDEIVCVFEYEGTKSALSFFSVFPRVADRHVEFANRVEQKYPDVFYPSISPPDNKFATVDADALEDMLTNYPGLFDAYGEIGLYANQNDPVGLSPDSERLKEIYPVVRQNGLVIYFHLGEGHKEEFEKILNENPDINFIFHGDQLIQCATCKQNLDEIDDILENHSNAYYGIDELYGDVITSRENMTKEEYIAHISDHDRWMEKDLKTWKPISILYSTNG